jgi:hypothetical protein
MQHLPTPVRTGDEVTFADSLGHQLSGTVAAVDGSSVTATYSHAYGGEKLFVASASAFTVNDRGTAAAHAVSDASNDGDARKRRKTEVTGRAVERLLMDSEEGRDRGCCCPTFVFDILHDVDSKHHRAAQQGYLAMAAENEMPMLVAMVDNEFFPHLAIAGMLKQNDPAIIMPAIGHELKAAASGQLNFNMHVWSRRLIEARRLRYDTPAFNKLVKGSNIRATVKHVLMEDYVLRVANAKRYLRAHPEVMDTFAKPDAGATGLKTETIIDAFGRTTPFTYSAAMLDAARAMRTDLEATADGRQPATAGVATSTAAAAAAATVMCDSIASWAGSALGSAAAGTLPQEIVDDVERRVRNMPATKPKLGATEPSIGDHCAQAGVSITGLRAADQKRCILIAYYLAGLSKLPSGSWLESSLTEGRFADAQAHRAGLAAAEAAVPHAKQTQQQRSLPPWRTP